jgi:hypothetical protein
MKLFILRPIDTKAGPWTPWYDRCFGMVVRASSKESARSFASLKAGPEVESAWLSHSLSSCDELPSDGPEEVVIEDVHYA